MLQRDSQSSVPVRRLRHREKKSRHPFDHHRHHYHVNLPHNNLVHLLPRVKRLREAQEPIIRDKGVLSVCQEFA